MPARVQEWRHDVALFALASAAIMHCYNAERDVFKSKYLNVLDFVFGNAGHGRQSIKHVGSFAVLANPSQMGSPVPPPPSRGGGGGKVGKRPTLKTLLNSPDRRQR